MKIFGYYITKEDIVHKLDVEIAKLQQPPALPVKVLDEEMRAAFATADANALWKPIHFMLAFAIEQLTAQVCSQKLSQSPNLMSHAAGALNALREFQYNLHRQHEESKKATEGS